MRKCETKGVNLPRLAPGMVLPQYSAPVSGTIHNSYVPFVLDIDTINSPTLGGLWMKFLYVLRSLGMFEFWLKRNDPPLWDCVQRLVSWASDFDPKLTTEPHN